jgi:hypothetical protein
MYNIGFVVASEFLGDSIIEKYMRASVLYVHNTLHRFSPKFFRHFLSFDHWSHHIEVCPVFFSQLRHSVVVCKVLSKTCISRDSRSMTWISWTDTYRLYPISKTKCFFRHFLNHDLELLEGLECLRFFNEEVHPTLSWIVVDESDEVLIPTEWA